MKLRPSPTAATPTDPDPMNGSITSSPGWVLCLSKTSLTCAIRSRVLPEADVIYFNPRHPDAVQVLPLVTRPFDFAECLHTPPMLAKFREA